MSWSSKLIPEGNITSDILPDNIINQFKLLLNELILQNKTENTLEKYDEIFLDLIGCLIYGKITSKGIFHLFNLCNLSTIELGQEILTDVVWYWGIQVLFLISSSFCSYCSSSSYYCCFYYYYLDIS